MEEALDLSFDRLLMMMMTIKGTFPFFISVCSEAKRPSIVFPTMYMTELIRSLVRSRNVYMFITVFRITGNYTLFNFQMV